METSVLSDLGFTQSEIKIYLALLELGVSKAGAIIGRTKLQNSVVHLTLSHMVEKGLVSFVRKGQVRFYSASDPRNIVRIIEEKRERFENMIPQLLARQTRQERQEAEVFEGMQGLKAMLYKVIEDGEPGDEYLFFAFMTEHRRWDAEVYEFYGSFKQERERRGITVKGIAPESRRALLAEARGDVSDVLFVGFPVLQNISIFRNKVTMTPWEEKQVSFLITSRHLSDSFRAYFHSIYSHYRK